MTKRNRKRIAREPIDGLRRLRQVCDRLRFEPHDIARQLDERGRYEVELSREFPFVIKLFHYTSRQHTRGPTWHERLELFLPLDGQTHFRMGNQDVWLQEGDLLVVDNFKLHHVVDFPGFDTRAVVVSFMPEFVYSLGSPSHDYTFLLPFYSKAKDGPCRLRSTDAATSPVYAALASLLERYFLDADQRLREAGCKAFLLTLLYHLAGHCSASNVLNWEFVREQQRCLSLRPLFEHISRHFEAKLTVSQAAALVHMSQPKMMKTFKRVAGMTLVAYLNHVRVSHASKLLRESPQTIAEVGSPGTELEFAL